ncbi:MAG: flagellar type III secretion system protein FlhB [Rhodomicrobium sp.]
MSDQSETDSKTEEATEKRRQEALEREGGPFSREVGSAAILMAVALFLVTAAPGLVSHTARELAIFLEDPGAWHLDNGADAILLLQAAVSAVSALLIPFAGIAVIAAIAASVLQNMPRFILSRIEPDLSRISLGAGFGRLFNSQSLVEFLKGLAKTGLVGVAAFWGLGGLATGFYAVHASPEAIPDLIGELCARVAFISAILASIIAAADIFHARRAWNSKLRMTKQEIKEELKQAEGNPILKARVRAIARARIKRRMMQNVPKATLVVANPTHYAVALRYVRGEDAAPKVLAKGQDAVALRIRQIAEQHNIPVVEDKALARSLFDAADAGQLIPPEFYKAVAEIIIYLSSKSRPAQRKPGNARPRQPPVR